MLRLQVMGPLRVWRGETELDAGPRQQRCMLALLMARVGEPVSTSDLLVLLWGHDSPASAVNIVHKYVGALRRLFEPNLSARNCGSYLLRSGSGYRLIAGLETLDLLAFRRLVAAAKASTRQGQPEAALSDYLAALRLCRGTAGEALAESAEATAVFAAIDGEFFDAVVDAAEIAIRLHEPSSVLSALRLAAGMDPFHELVHARLVAALASAGRQAEALAAYEAIRWRLRDDLGIDPGQTLQDTQWQVLMQLTTPVVDESVPPLPPTPWAVGISPELIVRPAQLPPDLSLFVGRSAELTILGDLVAGMQHGERGGPLLIAVDGMGGVGKSTLAVHFAHLIAHEFTDGQLYLDLHGDQGDTKSVEPGEALRHLLYAVGVPASHLPDTVEARLGRYRSLTAGKRVLVLLDNVRDSAHVRALLPNSAQSLVIVTSRRPLLGLAASDGAFLLRLHVPDLRSARELLRRRLFGLTNRTASAVESAEVVDDIIELCGRLPLALAVLAARLTARPALSLTSVAADLRDGSRWLRASPGDEGTPDPRTAFSWSYQQLSSGPARLFRLLGASLRPGISEAACVSLSGRDLSRTRAELEELTEAALVTEPEEGRFTSHMLVKAYAQELFLDVETATGRREAISRLLQYYLHSSFNAQVVLAPHRLPIAPPPPLPGVLPERPTSYQAATAWFAKQREVLKEAVRVAAEYGYGIVPWQLAITMQQYLQWAGYFQDWEDIMRWALRAARDSGDEVGEAHTLRSLAGARWSFHANHEALDLLLAALKIFEKQGMSLEQALVHTNLHWVYEALGQDDQALPHSQEAMSLYRVLGYPRGVTFSLMSSGRSLARLGRLDESAALLDQALDLHEEIRSGVEAGWDATSIAVEAETRMAVAANLIEAGRNQEAAEQLELSAEMSGRVSQRPNQFEALRRLAALLLSLGDTTAANEALARAGAVLAVLPDGGPDHLRVRWEHALAGFPPSDSGDHPSGSAMPQER